jgi:HPt (histidine-containing phosphotransfer) domain-containing protein
MPTNRTEAMRVERLQEFTDGDAQLERELSSLYLSTATLYLDEMRASLTNAEEWRRTAHALKGASGNIGAVEVARLAAEAERSDPAPDRLAGLEDALEEVRRFFRDRGAAVRPLPAQGALA